MELRYKHMMKESDITITIYVIVPQVRMDSVYMLKRAVSDRL